MKRIVIIMLLYLAVGGLGCSSLGGKVETSFTETVTDPEGFTTTTGYSAVSKAGMFGQLDTSSHTFRYDFGEETNVIASGQDAIGQDNTGNQVAMAMVTELLQAVIQQVGAVKAREMALRATLAEAQIAAESAALTSGQPLPWERVVERLLAERP